MSGFFIDENGLFWIDDKPYPSTSETLHDDYELSDIVLRTRRAHLTFENTWTLSIAWGSLTFSANGFSGEEEFHDPSPTAEIAVLSMSGQRVGITEDGDTVLGHQTTDDVRDWISRVSTWGHSGVIEALEPEL